MENSCIPSVWRDENITFIYKKGTTIYSWKLLGISLTCITCNVVESIIRDAIIHCMQTMYLFSKRHYRFMSERSTTLVVVYPLPLPLLVGGPMFPLVVHQPASPSIWSAVQSLRRGLSTNPGVTMWCVCRCSWRYDVCRVCRCYRGGIVVMDVFWRRLCVSMIWGREICLF